MTIGEMWHYMVFQTKGYRRLQAGVVIGALTAAAIPYVNSIFYASILDQLMLAEYNVAVRMVVSMTLVILSLNLMAKGCERVVRHYCMPCESEIKKRTAQKAFTMEYEMIDQTETLTSFRRVRAGEIGMGGVGRQLLEIYQFFQDLVGIIFAMGFVLVLFANTDSTKENLLVSWLLSVFMCLDVTDDT